VTEDYADFDLDAKRLPEAIRKKAFRSGGFPYDDKLDGDVYDAELHRLHLELVKLQRHLVEHGERVVLVFEGRDAAGKSSSINAYREHLNPRTTIAVALPKPTERERHQWYFQRYVAHLPAAGETVMFDRSWYNRAVVEPAWATARPRRP
jgi:polyphosphate kinase 2 (PPK2 family)